MGFLKNLFSGSSAPKPKPVPASPPLMPKHSFSTCHWVRMDFEDDPADQQRAKAYIHKQVSDFRTAKELKVRWLVKPIPGGFGLFIGRTMMHEVATHELLQDMFTRVQSLNAPLVLEGQYMWEVKAGPFWAYLFLPKEPATVELVPVP